MNSSTRSASARARGSGARIAAPAKTRGAVPILIVDDDSAIRRTLSEILTMHRYSVRTASNGAEALQIVGQIRPALVLLDMRMPLMDGWTFARELRERGTPLPLIVMGAADKVVEWCFEVGGVESLGKPFDLQQLLGAVDRVYRRSGTLRL